jgi:hypothetical protein
MTCHEDLSMNTTAKKSSQALHLRAGDVVEVRGPAEILATLGDDNTLGALPFMPEMLQYCGKRFRVYKRAHKTCDLINGGIGNRIRRMEDAVFLEDLRCDGEAHGECQAQCLIFWKEAWLKKVPRREARSFISEKTGSQFEVPLALLTDDQMRQAHARLLKSVKLQSGAASSDDIRYCCQATELWKASTLLPWWDVRQYWQDWRSGNVKISAMIRALAIFIFNKFQHYRHGGEYPLIEGKLTKTPQVILNVQPGELVRLKSKDEISKTLDRRNRNRGLSFDRELAKFCGGTYRVARRVTREINHKTGQMMNFHSDCIVLEGVVCEGDYNRFCQRRIFSYVRETWLELIDDQGRAQPTLAACPDAMCEKTLNAAAMRTAESLSEK